MRLLLSAILNDRMPLSPDAIPETALVGLFGRLNRTTRRAWAERGLLRKAPRGQGYEEKDAAELAAFMELNKELEDFYDAVAAWRSIKPRFEVIALEEQTEEKQERRLIAIFDPEAQQGTLVTKEEEIGPLVMGGPNREHVFRAIDLSERVRIAREAFKRAVEARQTKSATS